MTDSAPPIDTEEVLMHVFKALSDKQAVDIRALDVSEVSSITNYMVVASGTSNPHLKALRGEVEKTLKDLGVDVLGSDTSHESGWMVVDAFDLMIHLFTPLLRESYGLETLWRDGVPVDPQPSIQLPS